MNIINSEKSCFRRERPEALIKITAMVIAVILYIPYVIIVLAFAVEKSFLRMMGTIAGKIREKVK